MTRATRGVLRRLRREKCLTILPLLAVAALSVGGFVFCHSGHSHAAVETLFDGCCGPGDADASCGSTRLAADTPASRPVEGAPTLGAGPRDGCSDYDFQVEAGSSPAPLAPPLLDRTLAVGRDVSPCAIAVLLARPRDGLRTRDGLASLRSVVLLV